MAVVVLSSSIPLLGVILRVALIVVLLIVAVVVTGLLVSLRRRCLVVIRLLAWLRVAIVLLLVGHGGGVRTS